MFYFGYISFYDIFSKQYEANLLNKMQQRSNGKDYLSSRHRFSLSDQSLYTDTNSIYLSLVSASTYIDEAIVMCIK